MSAICDLKFEIKPGPTFLWMRPLLFIKCVIARPDPSILETPSGTIQGLSLDFGIWIRDADGPALAGHIG
jgi:hypothetical protein